MQYVCLTIMCENTKFDDLFIEMKGTGRSETRYSLQVIDCIICTNAGFKCKLLLNASDYSITLTDESITKCIVPYIFHFYNV